MKEHFDFSGYPKDHPNYDISNAKSLGKFKDEVDGKNISESIHLKPKLYCMEILRGDEKRTRNKKKSTGNTNQSHKQTILYTRIPETLYEYFKDYTSYNTIRSINHGFFSISCNTLALSNFDNKRYYINRVGSLAHGHYKIKQL